MSTILPGPVAPGAHLVGSVPLASPEVVFRAVADKIGDRLRRIPDGETGPRPWRRAPSRLYHQRPELRGPSR